MVALVRGLVEWVPTSAAWAGYVAGPLVLLGYAVGSIPFGHWVATRRFRRQLDRGRFPSPRFEDLDTADVVTALLTAATALLVATVAWDVGLEAAPRGRFSAVGTYANQALGAWVSIALWTGAAAVVGSMAPLWTGFRRGGSGVAPALALLAVYAPLLAIAAVGVAALVWGALGQRPRVGLAGAVAVVIPLEYLLWITDTQLWGVTHGPEAALWVTVLGVVLLLGSRETAAGG